MSTEKTPMSNLGQRIIIAIIGAAIMIGGIVTAVLFMIGKLALEEFLVKSNIGSVFETSASIVLILLFIFYSSLIMYYGAAFTLVVSQELNKTVKPTKYAEQYEVKTMEK